MSSEIATQLTVTVAVFVDVLERKIGHAALSLRAFTTSSRSRIRASTIGV
jgi:hypothetical protein